MATAETVKAMTFGEVRTARARPHPEMGGATGQRALLGLLFGSRPRTRVRVARTMPTRTDHVTLMGGTAALAVFASQYACGPQRDGRAALWPMSR